jgi:pyridoxine 4-dehydrogenase
MDNVWLGEFPVGRIGFGAMQLPGPGVFGPPRDRESALGVLRTAIELGVNHIDTAQYYGPDVSNELIREALWPYPPDLVLVSKVGAKRDAAGGWLPAHTPPELRAGVQENLRSLRVERLHAVNLRVIPGATSGAEGALFAEQLQTMVDLRDEGLIAGVGLSNVSVEQLEFAVEQTAIVCVQNSMNLLDRTSAPVLELCTRAGIAFVPFFPLGSGFGAENKVLSSAELRSVAQRIGVAPTQVALSWLLGLAPNVALIPGTSSVEHLRENLASVAVELDDTSRSRLTALGEA